jgi:hypothetical protein
MRVCGGGVCVCVCVSFSWMMFAHCISALLQHCRCTIGITSMWPGPSGAMGTKSGGDVGRGR